MQDRFKFRLYDKAIGEMVYDVCVGFIKDSGKTDDWVCADTSCGQITYRDDKLKDIVLMQCTGLQDKNGKLIYEGDILDLYVSSKKLYRYEVKYEIGSFMLVSQDEIFDFPNVWNDYVYPLSQLYYEYQNEENCIDECEIIGNIYENTELLKDDE